MKFVLRRIRGLATFVVVTVAAAMLVAFSWSSTGRPVRHVALNDSGIWVTNDKDGVFGRVNKSAATLDGFFNPPGGAQSTGFALDVRQDSAAVVAWDQEQGKLYPVDVENSRTYSDAGIPFSQSDQVDLRGGTLAALDPSDGAVRATRFDADTALTELTGVDDSSSILASVGTAKVGHPAKAQAQPAVSTTTTTAGAGAKPSVAGALAVGEDGTVYAASTTGRLAVLGPTTGGFGKPTYTQLSGPLTSVQVTAVGNTPVVYDATSGRLLLPHGVTVSVPADATGRIQQPGPATSSVVLEAARGLYRVSMSNHQVTLMHSVSGGNPTAPVQIGGCIEGAWGSPGAAVASCNGAPVSNLSFPNFDVTTLISPVFRENRGQVVINDTRTGAVLDPQTQQRLDDWEQINPPTKQQPNNKKNNEQNANSQPQQPKTPDQTLQARPGTATVLHVLDACSDPNGFLLSISSLGAVSDPAVKAVVSPDEQTVEVTLPAGYTKNVHFRYYVTDGAKSNNGTITVDPVAASVEHPPAVPANTKQPTYSVAAEGSLSIPAVGGWRDPENDPVVLVSAKAASGTATVTQDGRIDFSAPGKGGSVVISYQATDGLSPAVAGSVRVEVVPLTSTHATAATTAPDVAVGQVGQPIVIHPLANDIPGVDPTTPDATLQLAGQLPSPGGLTVTTDLKDGSVTVVAVRANIYTLSYSAAFGNAPFKTGEIRLDVRTAAKTPAPVAMPDTAVLRGQLPATVDVLANDVDPAGGILTVQSATAGDPNELHVAVIQGHWLRILAATPTLGSGTHTIDYTVTNGLSTPVTGQVSVSQLPTVDPDPPVARDDVATVRTGDSVTIPVLDNDYTVGGSPISLAANAVGAPRKGELAVYSESSTATTGLGTAYVVGQQVRYVAAAGVTTPQQVEIQYVAQNPEGDQATGHVEVTVEPLPTVKNPDQAPTPTPVVARVVAGDTATVTVPTTGVDPDGDSVTLTGATGPTSLGRVMATSATSLSYQAYPSSSGTDSFGYQVIDRFGKVGTSTVQVAVVPPSAPQSPLAVPDYVTAAPGATVAVDVLANDLIAPDDVVTVSLPQKGTPAKLLSGTGPVSVIAPADGKPPVHFSYADTSTGSSTAEVTVRSQAGYDVPPVAVDAYAQPSAGATSVTVDVLDHDFDPDGNANDLKIDQVFGATATISGSSVTVPVLAVPQTLTYQISDAGGASSAASIYVPASGVGAPYVKAGASISLPTNGKTPIDIGSYVVDPAGKPVRLFLTKDAWASPPSDLSVTVTSKTGLALTATNGYSGPAAVTFKVTDGTTLNDPLAKTAILTIPVQVGARTPVVRCPTAPLTLVEGGVPLPVRIASVCHVWSPDPAALPTVKFAGTFKKADPGVTLTGSGTPVLTLTAGGASKPGSSGSVTITVPGTNAVPSLLSFNVVKAPPPTVDPITVDGFKAGGTATLNLLQYLHSPLADPAWTVLSITHATGMPASASIHGTTVDLTPASDAHGTITFSVVASDVAAASRTDRQVTGQITMHVLNKPDAPGQLTANKTPLNQRVRLNWSAPASNGAAIDYYTVNFNGQTQRCSGAPCDVKVAQNGTFYNFTVTAHNQVGDSKPSSSVRAEADQRPAAPVGLQVTSVGDKVVHLSWSPPQGNFSQPKSYVVSWPGSNGPQTIPGTQTTYPAPTTTNDTAFVFTVVAVNDFGAGFPARTLPTYSEGQPKKMDAPTLGQVTDSGGSSTRTVQFSWPTEIPNGPPQVVYTLTRSGPDGTKVIRCADPTATTCLDENIDNNGAVYSYTIQATNATGKGIESDVSDSTTMEASSTPGPINNFSAKATGSDGQATLKFDVPPSNGAQNDMECQVNGGSCGRWSFPSGGQNGVTETIGGLSNGVSSTIQLMDCNGGSGSHGAEDPCDGPVTASVTAYGPLGANSLSVTATGTSVSYSFSITPNGLVGTLVVTSSHGYSRTWPIGATGTPSNGDSESVGYSTPDTFTATFTRSDGARWSDSKGATTGPQPGRNYTVEDDFEKGTCEQNFMTGGTWYKSNTCGGHGNWVGNGTVVRIVCAASGPTYPVYFSGVTNPQNWTWYGKTDAGQWVRGGAIWPADGANGNPGC